MENDKIKTGSGLLSMLDSLDAVYYPPSREDMEKAFKEMQKMKPPKNWGLLY